MHPSFDGDCTSGKNPSTGPFVLDEFVVGERVRAVSRVSKGDDGYWQEGADGKPLPYLDTVEWIDLGDDQTAHVAALQGVNANFVYLGTMAVGCALAGFAGGVMAPVFAVSPKMGGITLLIILVVMLGGVGSMPGVILSGLILGLILSFGQYFLEGGVAQIIFFAVIAIILFFRPGGLFGQAQQISLQ